MALTDKRPIALPVTATHTPASPSFNPKTLSVATKARKASFALSPITEKLSIRDEEEELEQEQRRKHAKSGLLSPNSNNEEDEDEPEDDHDEDMEEVGSESIISRSISPDSLMNEHPSNEDQSRESTPPTTTSTPGSSQNLPTTKQKKKSISRAPIATGISTTIPVTGEKPKPEQTNDQSLEDDVLYAIFVILYQHDAAGQGMTVKQICDVLTEQHPEMASLSTKTSNLVSAKLNAYVKRVEKGDVNLKYAISRDWADASPKRMVYVYRGILAPDFHVYAKQLMEEQQRKKKEQQEQQQQLEGGSVEEEEEETSKSPGSQSPKSGGKKGGKGASTITSSNSLYDSDPLEAGKEASLAKPRRLTMFDLGVTRLTFWDGHIDKSNWFVPYLSAPVTASLTENSILMPITKEEDEEAEAAEDEDKENSDLELDFEVFADSDEDENVIETFKKNNKRSKSMSYLSSTKKNKGELTAAAAAPRASRAPSSHSPNAAAAAAALHAAALKAISTPSSTSAGSNKVTRGDKKWLNVIRSGFMTQDIGTPEDISLSELDKFFN